MGSEGLVLELRRELPARPARLFDAFSDPAQLEQWWGPEGFMVRATDFTVETGRAYRIEMRPPAGDAFFLHGVFREVEPARRLAFTFVWEPPDPDDVETLVELTFVAQAEATELALRQGGFRTPERLELHRGGWTDSLDKLGRLLADSTG